MTQHVIFDLEHRTLWRFSFMIERIMSFADLDVLKLRNALLLVALPIFYRLSTTIWSIFYNLFLSPLRKFPGPKVAGLTEWWGIYHTMKCDKFYAVQELHEKHGDVVRIGPNEISVASPKVFHHVFVTKCSSFSKSDFYKSIQPGTGPKYSGLFNYTDHHQSMAERRDLQPMFSPAKLRLYEGRYDCQLLQLISVMKEKKEIDLFTYFKFLLLDAIGDLAFNQSFNQLHSGEEHQYVVDFNNAFMLIGLQNTFAWLVPLIPFIPYKKLRDAYFGLQRVFTYAQERVHEYLKLDVSQKEGTLIAAYIDPITGNPKANYNPWYIALSGHGFLVAGSEATSITLTYVFWILIKHPEYEQRLRAELSTLPEDYSSLQLAALPFLDALLRETLRLYPPAPSSMPRVVPQQGFSIEGVFYPPNTVLSVQPYTLHRCAEVFDQPGEFNPDRWLDVSKEVREEMNKAFIPFSAGPRGCIGRGLALIHMQKAVAKLLEHFNRFELREDMTDDDMTLIERGALAKPKATKLWVRCYAKQEPSLAFPH